MTTNNCTVFIIEDDQSVRDSLGLLLGLKGYPVILFASAESFLAAYQQDWRGCLLIDIRMPGMDGLSLQKKLLEQGCTMPVIIMTGHGDVDSARAAFRNHATDFLEKPIDQHRLMAALSEACTQQSNLRNQQNLLSEFELKLKQLTPREQEIMNLVINGLHNRDIARSLNISPRTVEVHKSHVMSKLRVNSVAELVRASLEWRNKQH